MPSHKFDALSLLMFLLLAALWGGSFFFAEIALTEVPPLTMTLHRVLWAVPLLYGVLLYKGLTVPKDIQSWFGFLVMGALNNAIPFSLIFWGQTEIEGGLSAILNATTGIIGAIVAGALLVEEPLTRNKLCGALIGAIGVAVIIGLEQLTQFTPYNLAQVAILGAAFSYALASVWGKRRLSTHPPLVNAFGMVTASVIIMCPIAVTFDGVPSKALSLPVWSALAGLALLSTAVAYYLYFSLLPRIGAANLMLVTLVIPPFAIGLGALYLDEALEMNTYFGLLIIALGLSITDGRVLSRKSRSLVDPM